MLPIRLATPDDLETILTLIDDAANWLRTMNTDQWSKPWPDRVKRDARVLRGLVDRRTWLVEDDGVPVATVTYRPDGNQDLWTPEEQAERSVYMSRLVVNRKYAGQGIGAALIDWAGARGRIEFGALTLRIDVWTTNYPLHDYYKSQGFDFLRKYEEDKTYPSAALFCKPTELIKMAPETLFREVHPNSQQPREHTRKL
jgi:GNAT superfamily N-acetyltransferase